MLFFSTVAVWLFAVCKSEIDHSPPCKLRDAYGYDNIDNDYDFHDWVLAKGPSASGTPTGPSSNRANDDGCYLLHKTTKANPEEYSLLVSSCYTKLNTTNDQPLLRFFHYTYGRDVGSLQVHLLRHDCLQPSSLDANTMVDLFVNEENKIWEVIGSQADSWTRAAINLDVLFPAFPFQIVFKAVVGNGTLSDLALDEIRINGIECYRDSFLCDDGNCISKEWVCDDLGTQDCIDGTDEPEPGCCNPFTKFQCMTSGRCIDIEKRCNGVTGDCDVGDRDNSDETNCTGSEETTSVAPITDISIISTSYHSDGLTSMADSRPTTEVSTGAHHNTTNTFCQEESVVSGFNNCSFLGIIVGIILVVFAALIASRVANRFIRNSHKKQKQKSIAASDTTNSPVLDYSMPLDNLETGEDNAPAKYEVISDGMTSTTINGQVREPQYVNGDSISTTSLQNDGKESNPKGKSPFYMNVQDESTKLTHTYFRPAELRTGEANGEQHANGGAIATSSPLNDDGKEISSNPKGKSPFYVNVHDKSTKLTHTYFRPAELRTGEADGEHHHVHGGAIATSSPLHDEDKEVSSNPKDNGEPQHVNGGDATSSPLQKESKETKGKSPFYVNVHDKSTKLTHTYFRPAELRTGGADGEPHHVNGGAIATSSPLHDEGKEANGKSPLYVNVQDESTKLTHNYFRPAELRSGLDEGQQNPDSCEPTAKLKRNDVNQDDVDCVQRRPREMTPCYEIVE